VELQAVGVLADAVVLDQFLFRPAGSLHITGLNVEGAKLLQGQLIVAPGRQHALDLFDVRRDITHRTAVRWRGIVGALGQAKRRQADQHYERSVDQSAEGQSLTPSSACFVPAGPPLQTLTSASRPSPLRQSRRLAAAACCPCGQKSCGPHWSAARWSR